MMKNSELEAADGTVKLTCCLLYNASPKQMSSRAGSSQKKSGGRRNLTFSIFSENWGPGEELGACVPT